MDADMTAVCTCEKACFRVSENVFVSETLRVSSRILPYAYV